MVDSKEDWHQTDMEIDHDWQKEGEERGVGLAILLSGGMSLGTLLGFLGAPLSHF